MNSLDKAKALAQRDADAVEQPMIVLNLNPFSPMYVVRDWFKDASKHRNFVCEIRPSNWPK